MNTTGKFSLPNLLTAMVVCIYCIGLIWWCWLRYFDVVGTTANYLFNIPMALSPLIVGSVLIVSSLRKSWSFSLKRYSLYFGGYLFFWGLGIFCTIFYNVFLHIELQYPSLLDIANTLSQLMLFIAIIAYIIEVRQITHVKNIFQKILFFGAAPIIQLTLYWIVMVYLNHDPIPRLTAQSLMSIILVLLNLISFTILYVLAFVLIFQKVDKQHLPIFWLIISGMTLQYINDYYFIIVLAQGEFYIGSLVDGMYLSAYVLMSYIGIQIYKRTMVNE